MSAQAPRICILTAGKGSRLGALSDNLNKALLPLDRRAIISQIVRRFPSNSEFVIGLGHLGEQVKNYLEMAHPDRIFHFANVDRYEGKGSGPGYSLLCCREFLQRPFYFVSCDTLWDNFLDFSLEEDWLGVAYVEDTENFCNLRIDGGRVVELRDKSKVDPVKFRAFTGLCYIHHYEEFFEALESKDMIRGEHQISNGLRALIEKYRPAAVTMEWIDTGNESAYRKAVERYEDFDFSKDNEALYSFDSRIVKFFADSKIAANRVCRAQMNPDVFPKIDSHRGQFYSYPYVSGKTLYERCTPEIFKNLLSWLHTRVWKAVRFPSDEMTEVCRKFYFEKTQERLALYYKKLGIVDGPSRVNGQELPKTSELLSKVDWSRIFLGSPCFFHGDLQFDNILYDQERAQFTLLDWRQDFAGQVEFGDLYYDLGKLRGGLVLHYDTIKANFFWYEESENGIFLDFVRREAAGTYQKILDEFVREQALDIYKSRMLVPLIYLNMAPLHQPPFDKFLYSLGRLLLKNEIENLER